MLELKCYFGLVSNCLLTSITTFKDCEFFFFLFLYQCTQSTFIDFDLLISRSFTLQEIIVKLNSLYALRTYIFKKPYKLISWFF